MFKTLEAGAEALLHTTCACLSSKAVKFVIVGGWSPYLRGSRPDLQHPGTRDVDVLFADEDRSVVEGAIKEMLSQNFAVSAKHAFQLLLPIKVENQEFVYNVDFLHPAEQMNDPDLLSDIFDLGIPDSSDPTGRRWVKSILFQSAKLVFDGQLYSDFRKEGFDVIGNNVTTTIPLLDETGLVLSKLNSVKQVKRPRDSYDIFYVLAGPNGNAASRRIQEIAHEVDEVGEQLASFIRWIDVKSQVFDGNVAYYDGRLEYENPSAFVRGMLTDRR